MKEEFRVTTHIERLYISDNSEYNKYDPNCGESWYEDDEGNTYDDKSEYLKTKKKKKINDILL
mgnify:CR=1 FL=1